MAGVRFCLKTEYEQAKEIVDSVLVNHGYSLEYSDAYNLTAERGSKAATMLVGVFAGKKNQHLVIMVNFGVWDQGGQVVSVTLANTGIAAGAIGVSRVQDAFGEITAALRGSFTQKEILAGEAAS